MPLMLSAVMLYVVMLNVVMLSVVILSVVMLNVVMLNVLAPFKHPSLSETVSNILVYSYPYSKTMDLGETVLS
jgi:hypothetical protein